MHPGDKCTLVVNFLDRGIVDAARSDDYARAVQVHRRSLGRRRWGACSGYREEYYQHEERYEEEEYHHEEEDYRGSPTRVQPALGRRLGDIQLRHGSSPADDKQPRQRELEMSLGGCQLVVNVLRQRTGTVVVPSLSHSEQPQAAILGLLLCTFNACGASSSIALPTAWTLDRENADAAAAEARVAPLGDTDPNHPRTPPPGG